jgi:hypothetical protein
LAVALAVGGILVTSPARAGFIQTFSGNTSPQDLNGRGVGVNSTVNFAVLDRSGNDPTDPWGTGYKGFTDTFVSGSAKKQILDTKAKYLYLYQVTNNQPASSKDLITFVRQELKEADVGSISSWGYFKDLGLADSLGPVSATNFFGNLKIPGNPAQASTGVGNPVSNPSVVAINGGVTPDSVTVAGISFTARWPNEKKTGLAGQDRSVLFGYTSSVEPFSRLDTVNSPSTFAKGTGVAPNSNPLIGTPEPPSLILMLTGVALASVFRVGHRVRCRVA